MPDWAVHSTDFLWSGAWGAVPMALLVAAACRFTRCRASTRHVLWLLVLVWFVAAGVLPSARLPARADSFADARASETGEVAPVYDTAESTLPPDADSCSDPWDATRSEIMANSDAEHSGRLPDRTSLVSAARDDAADGDVQRCGDGPSFPLPTPPRTVARSVPSRPGPLAPAAEPDGRLFTFFDALAQLLDRAARSGALFQMGLRAAASDPVIVGTDSPSFACDSASFERFEPPSDFAPGFHTGDVRGAPIVALSGANPPDHSSEFEAIAADLSREGLASPVAASAHQPGGPLSVTARWLSSTQRWLVAVQDVRDSVGRLPPLPAAAWWGGSLVLALIYAFRVFAGWLRVRHADPAPPAVARLVRECARTMRLSQLPAVCMIDWNHGPLVFCTLRPRLILPRRWWSELDDVGRRAVICHELAHLRRRDHWVCWFETIVGCLFWWHPLVWWARHRLREEAEYCCDAWVTWLLPAGRRAYAEALLSARTYVTRERPAGPVLGMGMSSVRANRFARRLTMVMTGTIGPRASLSGAALTAAIAIIGWAATPARSCPPEGQDAPAPPAEITPALMLAPPNTPQAPASPVQLFLSDVMATVASEAPAQPAAPPGYLVYSRALTPVPAGSGPTASLWTVDQATAPGGLVAAALRAQGTEDTDARLRRLEESIARLTERIEQLSGASADPFWRGRATAGGGHGSAAAPRATVKGLRGATATPAPGGMHSTPAASATLPVLGALYGAGGGGPRVARSYQLSSKGKLDALTQLLIRNDVPVLVTPGETNITIQATEAEHAAITAFLNVIDPEMAAKRSSGQVGRGSSQGGQGNTHALTEQLRVAELLSAEGRHGQARESLRTFEQAVKSAQDAAAREAQQFKARDQELRKALEKAREAELKARREAQQKGKGQRPRAEALLEQHRRLDELRLAMQAELNGRRVHQHTHAEELDALARQVAVLEQHAERIEHERDQLEATADSLARDPGRGATAAQEAEAALQRLEADARDVRAALDEARRQIERRERDAEEIEQAVESVEGLLEEVDDSMNESNGDLEETETAPAPLEPATPPADDAPRSSPPLVRAPVGPSAPSPAAGTAR